MTSSNVTCKDCPFMIAVWPVDRENSSPRSAYTSVGLLPQAARGRIRIIISDSQRKYLNMIGLLEQMPRRNL
jgi:hypothetical protein